MLRRVVGIFATHTHTILQFCLLEPELLCRLVYVKDVEYCSAEGQVGWDLLVQTALRRRGGCLVGILLACRPVAALCIVKDVEYCSAEGQAGAAARSSLVAGCCCCACGWAVACHM